MTRYDPLSLSETHDAASAQRAAPPSEHPWQDVRDQLSELQQRARGCIKHIEWSKICGAILFVLVAGLFVWVVVLIFLSLIVVDNNAWKERQAKEEAERIAGYLKPVLERLDRLEKLDRLDDILAKLDGIARKVEL